MTDFDYKKYSLENLEKWMEDALGSSDATTQEIYDVIQKVVSENYYHHKHHASRAYELMEKLNGGVTFTSCDKDDPSPECQSAWNDFWEQETPVYVSEDGDIFNTTPKKWILPVELDGLTGECYIQLPDDLLQVADLKEGDQVEWIDRKDGSFEMRKINGTK